MKLNYAAPLRVEELASQVQMGLSTFHQHFRQLTAMSPLQYQKWLRLNEAKRLMLNENCSGQLIPDTALSFSSATAGASPLLN